MKDQRLEAKEVLEQLINLKGGDLKENLKLQKKLEIISKIKDEDYYSQGIKNIVMMNNNADVLVKAFYFIDNNGKQSYVSEIMSTSKADVMKVFLKYQETFSDQEYWENLKDVYITQDYMLLPYAAYKAIFNSNRNKKEFLMNDDERSFLENLPEQIKIYRGGAKKEVKKGYGISWTLNKDIAQQFVDRKKHLAKDEMTILQLEISKSEVVAYFNERNEEEIIYLGK